MARDVRKRILLEAQLAWLPLILRSCSSLPGKIQTTVRNASEFHAIRKAPGGQEWSGWAWSNRSRKRNGTQESRARYQHEEGPSRLAAGPGIPRRLPSLLGGVHLRD